MESLNDAYIRDLVEYVGYYLKNGIIVNGKKMSFTALDYYCIAKDSIEDVATIIRAKKSPILYQGYFLQFAANNGLQFRKVEDAQEVLYEHNAFIKDGVRIVPTEEDIQNILDLLDSYNIPRYTRVVYTALARQAFGYPILPFAQMNEEEKEHRSSK